MLTTGLLSSPVVLSWDEKIFKLNKRYPGVLDESTMNRYLGLAFNPVTGALTSSMIHQDPRDFLYRVLLPPQRSSYTKDLFHESTDTTPFSRT